MAPSPTETNRSGIAEGGDPLADLEQLRQRLAALNALKGQPDRSLVPFIERAEVLLNYATYKPGALGALEEAEKALDLAEALQQTQAPVSRATAEEAARAIVNRGSVQADGGYVIQAAQIQGGLGLNNIVNEASTE